MAENYQFTQGLPEGKIVSQEIVTETVLTEEELRARGLIGQGFYGQEGAFTNAQPIIVNQGTPLTNLAQGHLPGHHHQAPIDTIPQGHIHGHAPVGKTTQTTTYQETVINKGVPSTTSTTTTKVVGATGAGLVGAGLTGHALGSDYKGTFVFKPLEGKFLKDKDPIGRMDPYVKIKIGWHSGKSSVARSEGTHPTWNDVIPLEKKHHEEFAKLKIKDKDRLTLNDKIGVAKIPLAEIAAKGHVQQWFPVYKKDEITGEILLDITFQPRAVV